MLDADHLALLLEIAADVRALREAAERERPRRPQNSGADFGKHLRAIAAVVEDRLFSVSELLVHAAIPEGEVLRAAIIGLVGTLNGRRLGKFLRSVEGENIAGLRIERIGADRLGVAWVLRVCESETRKPAQRVARR